ncbi:MAG TPA: 16S rRNA (adenine(1518)-N(6)/adenine(1519)-N(6))-dimethyltransferase RsmA [Planctomycetaceae bacterium]|nr:16S rRNA (adenine(1518)-N(6)/adenine(1519)-N(6))-dimethyltransferase RsmA [Planctomycetaceae bacterium]
MRDAQRQTRSHLMELFERHGFHPRTDLGQNFLIDLNLVEFIIRQADLGPRDVALEIGAGTGGMTTFLARQAGAVVSVEYDRNMHALAEEAVAGLENVTLLRTDALQNKNRFARPVLEALAAKLSDGAGRRLKLVANLPYSIATPVVSNLVATDLPWERMVVTIQLELAERMAAEPGSAHYGALSAWLQTQCRVTLLKRLKPTVFWPRPRVNSAIVRIVPDAAGREAITDRPFFQDFVRRLFQKRRKLMRGVLAGMYRKQLGKPEIDALLDEAGLGEQVRAEKLDPGTLRNFANRLYNSLHPK